MLDEQQQKIVDLPEGYIKVLATAGAGKSRLLLSRAVKEYERGKKTICLTFTSDAAKNLKTRAQKQFPHVDVNIFSTIHALALKFALSHPEAFSFPLADYPLAVDGEAAKIFFETTGNKINYRAFTSYVSLQKRRRITPQKAISSGKDVEYALAYLKYQEGLRQKGLLDFDDLLTEFASGLENHPVLKVQHQYEAILVDEAQDLSKLEWDIINHLSTRHKNLLCVGDAGQAVYLFRGSFPQQFLRMEEYFPGTETHYLSTNYRSSEEIVSFGRRNYPVEEISSRFKSHRGTLGIEPTITGYSTEYREAEEVLKKVVEYGPDNCAILARTNFALRAFEEEAIARNIPYYTIGDSSYWDSKEIKNVLAWIRCACLLTDHAITSAISTPFGPAKFLKKKVVLDKIKSYTSKGTKAWDALNYIPELQRFRGFILGLFRYQHLPASEAVTQIIKEIKSLEHYKDEENISPDHNPVENIKQLVKTASRFDTLREFVDFARKVSYTKKVNKGVRLSTIHSAKGLEFPHVFVVSVNEGILPHKNSSDPLEEKNIFYVAISRAEDTLDISYNGPLPSPYLNIKEN